MCDRDIISGNVLDIATPDPRSINEYSSAFVEFFKSGEYCKIFGHIMETIIKYDDCAQTECRHCGKEYWS